MSTSPVNSWLFHLHCMFYAARMGKKKKKKKKKRERGRGGAGRGRADGADRSFRLSLFKLGGKKRKKKKKKGGEKRKKGGGGTRKKKRKRAEGVNLFNTPNCGVPHRPRRSTGGKKKKKKKNLGGASDGPLVTINANHDDVPRSALRGKEGGGGGRGREKGRGGGREM